MKVKIRIGKAHLHLSNLFGGDTVLGKLVIILRINNLLLFFLNNKLDSQLENLAPRNNSNYSLK